MMSDGAKKDLIIIGAGINGLSAGLAYALNNNVKKKEVLIVEKNPISGGYVTSFNRKGFSFDTCQMISNVTNILDFFGIKLEWKEFKDDFIRIFKADTVTNIVNTIELHSSKEEFEKQMMMMFPDEAVSLNKFLNYSSKMFDELYGLKYAPNVIDMLRMLFYCPKVIRYASKSFEAYCKRFNISNPEIKQIFQVFSSFCGLPNGKIAALLTVGVMYSLLEKAYRPSGLFVELPQKMEKRFRELGGEVMLKTEVERIIVSNGKVEGVCLKNGNVIYSENIISTIDVKTTINQLIGIETIRSINPKYAKRIEDVKMTTSAFTVSLGLDDDEIPGIERLQCGYALLTSGNDAYEKLYNAFEDGKSGFTENCFNIGISYTGTQASRKPVISIQAIPMPVGNWGYLRDNDREAYQREKEKTAALLIDIVEKYLIPELRKHIAVMDISTPATYSRYSGSFSGSIYDMASLPENFGRNRIPVITPIKGLLLPKFAHGVFGTMNSGLQAVDILLEGKVMQGNSRF